MKESINEPTFTRKVFKERGIFLATFFGGPFAFSYLFAENLKTFGRRDLIIPTWLISICVSIVLFSTLLILPEDIDIPNFLIPGAYTLVGYLFYNKFQKDKVEKHLDSGGESHGWGRTLLVSILGLAATLALLFAMIFVLNPTVYEETTVMKYGYNQQHEIEFVEGSMSEKEVDKIAHVLSLKGYFVESYSNYIFVSKEEDKYAFYIVIDAEIENDEAFMQQVSELRDGVDSYFPDKDIEFNLSTGSMDEILKTFN